MVDMGLYMVDMKL